MSLSHQFGGSWTEEKLSRVKKYLAAYMTIFKGNKRASWYTTIYVDAFAGTGYRSTQSKGTDLTIPLFSDEEEKEVFSFQKGSAYTALATDPPFDQYLFVELNSNYVMGLESLSQKFPQKVNSINVVREEANRFLQSWCKDKDWQTTRAVVFLDPYGMQVEWKTIEAIAHTKGIDLWILCPLGQAVNRLLTIRQPPPDIWAERLTKFFGTEEWKKEFYQKPKQTALFGTEDSLEKNANFDSIGEFFINRLETVFAKVAQNPLPLRNSKNVPIFLLCFASANPKGAPTAVKIAQNILGK